MPTRTRSHRRRYAEGDRDGMLEELESMGFRREEIEDAPDETLAAILRVYSGHEEDTEDEGGYDAIGDEEPEDDEDGEDEMLRDLPEPADEEEAKEFAEHGRLWMRRGKKVMKHYGYADDEDSARGHDTKGILPYGPSKEPVHWDASTYARKFKENEAALRQFGIRNPEMLKRHREGKRVRTHCDTPLSRQDREGKGGGLADKYSEMPSSLRRQATKFAERRIRRGDSKYTGQTKQDYERIYLDATPAQRRELLGTN